MALHTLRHGPNLAPKRKHPGDTPDGTTTKRPRDGPRDAPTPPPPAPAVPASLSAQPLQSLVSELAPKYDIKTLSVLSSTSISKRVDAVLAHLGRFSATDPSVLPGAVLLYARAGSANKLITVVETVRRRIHEAEQKWWQYNWLYEMEWAGRQKGKLARENEVETFVEDTVMEVVKREEEEEEEDDFEVMATQRTVFERAVHGEDKKTLMAHMSIFLSRIPIPELKGRENFAGQSNEGYMEYLARKKNGLVA